MEPWRLTVLAGHYGSGKTELAVNLACAIGDTGRRCALCDLDVVNPYFRAREREAELSRHGVHLVASRLQGPEADVPALPAEIYGVLQDRTQWGVVDLGGDGAGARALARFAGEIDPREAQVLFVLNANRPETRTVERAAASLDQIRRVLGLEFTGIVNNTHLCSQTTPENVLAGAELAHTVSQRTGIPLLCHTAVQNVLDRLPPMDEPVFPIILYMKKPWE